MFRHPSVSTRRQALLEARAASMRTQLARSEAVLWEALRGGRLGTRFRCQVVIGKYIVDFFAPRERVIIEVDGAYHSKRIDADARRDRYLARLEYRVVRVDADAAVGGGG
jgi:very-short-patch-repair endonuclease